MKKFWISFSVSIYLSICKTLIRLMVDKIICLSLRKELFIEYTFVSSEMDSHTDSQSFTFFIIILHEKWAFAEKKVKRVRKNENLMLFTLLNSENYNLKEKIYETLFLI